MEGNRITSKIPVYEESSHPEEANKFLLTPTRTQQETDKAIIEWRTKLLGKTLRDSPAEDQTVIAEPKARTSL